MFYITKDNVIAAEAETRKKAMKYIRVAQARERQNGTMAEFSIISGGPREAVKYKEL